MATYTKEAVLERMTAARDAHCHRKIELEKAIDADQAKFRERAAIWLEKINTQLDDALTASFPGTADPLEVAEKVRLKLRSLEREAYRSRDFYAREDDSRTNQVASSEGAIAQIEAAIKLVQSTTGDTISTHALDKLGLLRFIKFS